MEKIKKQLSNQPLARVYIVHGPDLYRRDEIYQLLYQRVLQDGFADWNWVNIVADKNTESSVIIDELRTTPWGNGKRVVAVTDGEKLASATLDGVLAWLKKNQHANCLALFFTKVDKRLKSTKELVKLGVEVECGNLTGAALARWVSDFLLLKEIHITPEVTNEFLARVGNDLGLIKNELDKLIAFIGDRGKVTESDVEAITSLVPGQLEQGAIFKMVEAISNKNASLAIDWLYRLLDAGEPALRILPLIERQLRLLLAAKTRGRIDTLTTAKAMGESSDYALKKALRQHENFTLEQLERGFELVLMADGELKFGGNPQAVLERLILQLCAR